MPFNPTQPIPVPFSPTQPSPARLGTTPSKVLPSNAVPRPATSGGISRRWARGWVAMGSLLLGGLLTGCTPGGSEDEDAGAPDAGEVVDAGLSGPGPASEDAGPPPPPTDSGALDDCPAFNPVIGTPVGQSCSVEGLRCGPEGCLAPGPGQCAFVVCREGTWQFETQAPTRDDAGAADAAADAGAIADGGRPDAGANDAGANDAGALDAGVADAGSANPDAGAVADAG